MATPRLSVVELREYSMPKFYNYALAVWIRLETSCGAPDLLAELQEYLESKYQIIKIEIVDESDSHTEGEHSVSLKLQLTFDDSRMDGEDPTAKAIGEVDGDWRAYLEARYQVNSLELMDDAPTSFLLDEWDEPEERKYPEPKQRDLTEDEKSQLRARIERGDAEIYALATEFGCSASQVAGIKAAMKR
jgi:hypothetical protein